MDSRERCIAVVDDDESVRRALGRVLRAEGLLAEGFASAPEYLAAQESSRYLCMVLDIHLGDMSGLDLMEKLASEGRMIPVVLITAHDDEPTRDRARELGASGYLRKPLETGVFLKAVHQALEQNPPGGTLGGDP